ncbi:MAG: hypothetical protein KAJ30_07990 [Candidatus Heimdallarchaeota archaeon]|nr:hypothetical protein [Candidatus Heimdallarchaeota archaeon]
MTTVKTTLTKFLKFLKGLQDGTVYEKSYDKIKRTLRRSLDNNVFGHMQHEGNVYEIPTQSDLELLIMSGGRTHKPGQPRESHYSKEYLRKKRALSLPAHEWKREGFSANTQVLREHGKVLIVTPASATTVRGYNYGPIHESKKSVLKYAFLSAWQDIIGDIVDTFADEVR